MSTLFRSSELHCLKYNTIATFNFFTYKDSDNEVSTILGQHALLLEQTKNALLTQILGQLLEIIEEPKNVHLALMMHDLSDAKSGPGKELHSPLDPV